MWVIGSTNQERARWADKGKKKTLGWKDRNSYTPYVRPGKLSLAFSQNQRLRKGEILPLKHDGSENQIMLEC
jgi:hypothetical protein